MLVLLLPLWKQNIIRHTFFGDTPRPYCLANVSSTRRDITVGAGEAVVFQQFAGFSRATVRAIIRSSDGKMRELETGVEGV